MKAAPKTIGHDCDVPARRVCIHREQGTLVHLLERIQGDIAGRLVIFLHDFCSYCSNFAHPIARIAIALIARKAVVPGARIKT